jgi:hypothetical protein
MLLQTEEAAAAKEGEEEEEEEEEGEEPEWVRYQQQPGKKQRFRFKKGKARKAAGEQEEEVRWRGDAIAAALDAVPYCLHVFPPTAALWQESAATQLHASH